MAELNFKHSNGILELEFSGRLDVVAVTRLWEQSLQLQEQHKPLQLIVNASGIDYCDGAGIGLITELEQRQDTAKQQFKIVGLKPEFTALINAVASASPHQIIEPHEKQPHRVTISVGEFAVGTLTELRHNITFIGEVAYQSLLALLHPKRIRWANFWKAMQDVGPRALPIVALIGFLVGVISTFQAANPMGRFGAQVYLVNLVGLGLFREMGPLMTAVLLAGRTASAFAAEIGTMKVNQELDALTTMGLNPLRFLTVPWMMATTVMTPVLNLFFIFFGLVGCGLVMHDMGYSFNIFMHQLDVAVTFGALMGGVVKTIAFGIVIAGIGCMHGLKTKFGASAVGYSTTKAVVSSLIMIVVVDGVFAIVYFVLGI